MNKMIDSKTDNKNIGLARDNLWELRQALDVYCLVAANADSIEKKGAGKSFFRFLRTSYVHLIAIDICKIFEDEKKSKHGKVEHELNSIDGVLRSLADDKPSVLDSAKINSFVRKYSSGRGEDGTLLALSLTVDDFKTKYQKELERFKTFRNKRGAHSEFGFNPSDLPSYDVMEQLFNFGLDFYMLVSKAFISVGPFDLNSERTVRTGFRKVLLEHGIENVKNEME
ncbi:MAG: hypothetical protein MUO27_09855 [Sedimentisphaerales bacterium]|nr:hypothetical protein [Sedimentisphaerales bacterium]